MKNRRGGRGFTLAELLIVMAIIVVLAAVAIPTFGRQLETARETGDMELIRNAYNEALSMAILDGADGKLDGMNGTSTDFKTAAVHGVKIIPATADADKDKKITVEVTLASTLTQTENGWQYVRGDIMGATVGSTVGSVVHPAKDDSKATFAFKLDEGAAGAAGDGSVKLDTGTAETPIAVILGT